MKKYTGNFTTDAGKALKNSERLICCTDNDGAIYVTNGFIAYKLNPAEYAAIVQPVACCEAGNWSMRNGEKTEEAPFDLIKTFRDSVKAADNAAALELCPLILDTGKKGATAAAYYNAAQGFTAMYNTKFTAALAPGFTLRAPSATGAAIAYQDGEPFALILPIRPDEKASRAVKAYFTQSNNNEDEADKLRAELAALQDNLNSAETRAAALAERVGQQADEADRLNAKIATLEDELSTVEHNNAELQERVTQQAEEITAANDNNAQPAADPKTAAEIIAARFTGMDGVTATIKGAHTTAPVVWLSGDTDKHADEIKAAGAKWSGKKSAYYVRVA